MKPKKNIESLLFDIAPAEIASEDGRRVQRFFTGKGGGPVQPIRSLANLPQNGANPAMVILDLGDNGGYYLPSEEIAEVTRENLQKFIADFKSGSLERKQAQ